MCPWRRGAERPSPFTLCLPSQAVNATESSVCLASAGGSGQLISGMRFYFMNVLEVRGCAWAPRVRQHLVHLRIVCNARSMRAALSVAVQELDSPGEYWIERYGCGGGSLPACRVCVCALRLGLPKALPLASVCPLLNTVWPLQDGSI